MKKYYFFILCFGWSVFSFITPASAALRSDGFVDPLILQGVDNTPLSASEAFTELKKKALMVAPSLLERFPTQASGLTTGLSQKSYLGRLLVTAKDPNAVWFISPQDGKRYYFNGEDYSYSYFRAAMFDSVPRDKWIFISLSKQRLEERVGTTRLVEHTISSGKTATPTPTGRYSVLSKNPKAWSRLAGLWMPSWMQFTPRGHGIHELPVWPSGRREGVNHLGKPVSHGCVRLSPETGKSVYESVSVGTPVVIVR